MKEGIHPEYHRIAIRCACGNQIESGSTQKQITVDVCSNCHPFFTGKQKLIDTAGRIDKFNARAEKARKSAAKPEAEKSPA